LEKYKADVDKLIEDKKMDPEGDDFKEAEKKYRGMEDKAY
jgi:hypothetical protein